MLTKKIRLNNRIRTFIIEERKNGREQNPLLTADYISDKIGRAKSWLSQIENGRLQSVKTHDLINVFCIIKNKNINSKEDRENIENYLDNHIMFISITDKHGFFNSNGDIIDIAKLIAFQQNRDYLKTAGKYLLYDLQHFSEDSITTIQNYLKNNVKLILSNIVYWINRTFNDTQELFSDEISTRNLYLLLETSLTIYNRHSEYFGLNPISIHSDQMEALQKKLNTDYIIQKQTVIKPLNEYSFFEFKDVVKNFTIEEYMQWKNKKLYIGDDPFPLVLNYKKNSSSEDNFINYDDINKAFGLSEKEYLYIIKQLYTQTDVFYKYYRPLLQDYQDLQDENDELFTENERLKKEILHLKSKY